MKIKKEEIVNNIQLILFITFVFVWFISSNVPRIRYISIAIFGLFCIIQSIRIIKRKKIFVNNQIFSYFLFAIFSGLSFIWATSADLVFSKFFDLICNGIFMLMSYDFFINSKISIEKVLKIFMFIGFAFSIYVLLFYGVSNYFKMLLEGKRIGVEIINVNFIGLIGAFTFIITLYMMLKSVFKHKIFGLFVLCVTLIISLGSGSKKVLLNLIVGIGLIFFLNIKQGKLTFKKILKLFIALIIFYIVFTIVYHSSYFTTIFDRFNVMLDTFFNESADEGSTYIRMQLIKQGFDAFLNHPIGGVGLNNACFIINNYEYSYLHCNYVELLACTGIIGFVLYYYTYLKTIIVAYQKKNEYFDLIYILIFLMLFSDIGVVSYYVIKTAFYLLLCFIINSKIGDVNLNSSNKELITHE